VKVLLLSIILPVMLFSQEDSTMIISMTPNLMVKDVNRSVDFYRGVLGFDLVATVPDSGALEWAWLKNGSVELMVQTPPSLERDLPEFKGKPIGATQTLYTKVDNVKNLLDRIKTKAQVILGLRKTFYGMEEFTIKDPDGYLITFASEVTEADPDK
jgi:catechol 2,3-dioxygenase-like lactoylglutathione lyase family enzyme